MRSASKRPSRLPKNTHVPKQNRTPAPPQTIEESLAHVADNPLAFVHGAFAWGTGELKEETGPDEWQVAALTFIGEHCLDFLDLADAVRFAVASGHGIGKGALVAWIILWYMSTRPHPQVVVTANTKEQLEKKTWRELAKWHQLLIDPTHKAWFTWTATKFAHVQHPQTWFASAIPWSENRAEAFAGTHETHVLVIFDEASAIPDIIWETAEGAMTTPGAMFLALGNPTRTTGRFRECFPGGQFAHRWHTLQIDSRTAKKASQAQLQQWVDDYGEDSDFVRIRVRGLFPRASADQFISEALIEQAQLRFQQALRYAFAPIVVGVDVAWKGMDESVILVRQGGQIMEKLVYRELDPAELGQRVIKVILAYQPSAVFIDEVGIGAGTLAYCKMLGHEAIGVNAGKTAPDDQHYHDWGAYMWGQVKEWLGTIGALDPEDRELAAQLTAREYGYDHTGRTQLESKVDLRVRHRSPDHADALGFTFAAPVTPRARTDHSRPMAAVTSWDVMNPEQSVAAAQQRQQRWW
jgi:hypothetical protein